MAIKIVIRGGDCNDQYRHTHRPLESIAGNYWYFIFRIIISRNNIIENMGKYVHVHVLLTIFTGRLEITVPSFVVNDLRLNEILEPILSRLRTVMGHHPEPEIRTHNIVFAPVGSAAQEWHCDDSFRKGKTPRCVITSTPRINLLAFTAPQSWCAFLSSQSQPRI